jgi:hypothetical protein
MKIFASVLLLLLTAYAAVPGFAREQRAETKQEEGFYCNMDALDETQKKRVIELMQSLRHSMTANKELADGYEFKFPATITSVRDIGEYLAYERACCSFLNMELHMPKDSDAVWLRLTGRDGVKDLLREEFGLTGASN